MKNLKKLQPIIYWLVGAAVATNFFVWGIIFSLPIPLVMVLTLSGVALSAYGVSYAVEKVRYK